jgi:hypothetical protein
MRKGNYRTKYSQATIELAIQDIQEKRLSLNKAAKHYNVPKATLSNRINQLVQDQLGRPTELKKEEEEIIVERLMMMGDWGFPLTCKDLCLLIKSYLDGQGRTTRKMSRLTLPVISCFFLSIKRFCSCTIRYWYLPTLRWKVPVLVRYRVPLLLPALVVFIFDILQISGQQAWP